MKKSVLTKVIISIASAMTVGCLSTREAVEPTALQQDNRVEESNGNTSSTKVLLQLPFGDCGEWEDFTMEDWFAKTIPTFNKIKPNKICLRRDGKMLIVISQGDGMCSPGYVYTVDISADSPTAQKVTIDNKEFFSSAVRERECYSDYDAQALIMPAKVTEQNGDVLTIKGDVGGGGCGMDVYYEYNVNSNTITLKKTFTYCESELNIEDKWQSY